MTRLVSIIVLTFVLALGFSTMSVAKKGSGHSGRGGGHHKSHLILSDDSGRHRGSGAHGRTFSGERRHHHGEIEFGRHGVGEIEIHRSGGHD